MRDDDEIIRGAKEIVRLAGYTDRGQVLVLAARGAPVRKMGTWCAKRGELLAWLTHGASPGPEALAKPGGQGG